MDPPNRPTSSHSSSTWNADSSSTYNSTIETPRTPPETIASIDDFAPSVGQSSIPTPGETFLLVSRSDGRALSLANGDVTLVDLPNNIDAGTKWACVHTDGYLGFRNVVSGAFLGQDFWGNIVCSATAHNWWEFFVVRPHAHGGYMLLVSWLNKLRYVDVTREWSSEKLVRCADGIYDGIVFDFVRI